MSRKEQRRVGNGAESALEVRSGGFDLWVGAILYTPEGISEVCFCFVPPEGISEVCFGFNPPEGISGVFFLFLSRLVQDCLNPINNISYSSSPSHVDYDCLDAFFVGIYHTWMHAAER